MKPQSGGDAIKPGPAADDTLELPKAAKANRKSSVAKVVGKILFNPNKKGVKLVDESVTSSQDDKSTAAATATNHNQFRFTRGHGPAHKVLQLSADTLLSIVSGVCLFYSSKGTVRSSAIVAARKVSSQHPRKISMACLPACSSQAMVKVSLDPASITVRMWGAESA